MILRSNVTHSEDFLYLTTLIESGRARFEFNKFLLRNSFSHWLIYKGNQTVIWSYTAIHLVATEWVSIPVSIILAVLFHAWWIVIIGIVFSWTIDGIIKSLTPYILRLTLVRDEAFLNYLWGQTPFHIIIVSTQETKPSIIAESPITISPPHSWRVVVSEFGGL